MVKVANPVRILIIEDVDAMGDLLKHVLSGISGFQISGLAKNSWEARLEMTRRRPDLVLLDEVLPGESSLDLLSDLRVQQMPVILITSMEEPRNELPDGALGRICKPGWDTVAEDRKRMQKEIQDLLKLLKRA